MMFTWWNTNFRRINLYLLVRSMLQNTSDCCPVDCYLLILWFREVHWFFVSDIDSRFSLGLPDVYDSNWNHSSKYHNHWSICKYLLFLGCLVLKCTSKKFPGCLFESNRLFKGYPASALSCFTLWQCFLKGF